MKVFFLIGLLQMTACSGLAGDADKTAVLVKEGKALAKIYISGHLKMPEKIERQMEFSQCEEMYKYLAVKDLNYHLEKMSGTGLEIVQTENPAEVKAPAIVLGTLAVKMGAKPAAETESKEAFRILSRNGIVLIGGESDVGMMYGVYELLEKLGCDWVMPGKAGEVIPQLKTISVPPLDETQAPSFSIRCPWYCAYITREEKKEFDEWKMRHKNQPSFLDNKTFHPLKMQGGHVWDVLIKKYKKEFQADPSMLALVRQPDGSFKRRGPQLEITNPKVITLFERHIKDMFVKNKWPKNKKVCIGVGPADGYSFSESPETRNASGGYDPIGGFQDVTDIQILLCNQLLERLGKDYPNLYLGFYLYSLHGDYPIRYKPNPRVMPIIADINYSRFHSIFDTNSKSRIYYKNIMAKWGKLHAEQGNSIMFRSYNYNLAECLLPYTKLKMFGENIPYYKKMGCIGTYTEWHKNWSNTGPSDYLEVKLNWNSNLNWKSVLKKYCINAFGKGAPYLEKYYLNLVEKQHKTGMEAGSFHSFHLIYDKNFINDSNALFAKAASVADTKQHKMLISCFREPLEMLDLYLDYRKDFTSFKFPEAKRGFDKMQELWQKYYKINSNLVDKWGIKFLNRYQKKFIEEGLKYSTGKYHIVYQIPDRLKTMLDPYVKGQEMGFQNPQLNDKFMIKTATWSIPWDAQGLAGYRDGAVWYRIPFNIPEDMKDKPLGLFIGGTDDLARVWLNGKYIGSGKGFSKPFVFDLTENAQYGSNNLLAIQVQRFSKCTELGLGGIIYPSFVFTGPRLKQLAPGK
jgi:hypothetical protein